MTEANDEVKSWISKIKNHVNLDGIDGQEVHDFYSELDDAETKSFNSFFRKERNRTITGIQIQRASKGKEKYLKIDMKIFKTCLSNFHVDIDQMDIDNNDNNLKAEIYETYFAKGLKSSKKQKLS